MARFPGIRQIEICTRIDWCGFLPWRRVDHMQRNKVVFDSAAALPHISANRWFLKTMVLSLVVASIPSSDALLIATRRLFWNWSSRVRCSRP